MTPDAVDPASREGQHLDHKSLRVVTGRTADWSENTEPLDDDPEPGEEALDTDDDSPNAEDDVA